jgi:2-dehydro-3-deoxygluconokinase
VTLEIRAREDCAYDAVSLGEVMLRLDPGEGRIRTAREFRVWEGGGEYNVARGLARCFGLRTAIVTSLVDNEVGHLIEGLVLAGGVDTSWITWVTDDGIGRDVRNGLNFTERGFGVRGAKGVSDRGRSASSQLRPGDTDWEHLFGTLGVRWFHTGGIFAGLSAGTADVVIAAMEAARRHGTVVSYDLNYRPSLWGSVGGPARAREVNARIAGLVDVLVGNEEDFTAALGYAVEGASPDLTELRPEAYATMLAAVARDLPQLTIAAVTLRSVHSANRNDWGALAWSAEGGLVQATQRDGLEILDRVGGGDSFASGLVYALLIGRELAAAVEYGAAHGALAMTTPGDTSMASLAEVEALVRGAGARVQR